jgi:hypothetical protein
MTGRYDIFFGMDRNDPNHSRVVAVNSRILGGCIALLLAGAFQPSCADASVPLSRGGGNDGGSDSDADTDSDADSDTDVDSDADCSLDYSETFDGSGLPTGWEIEDFDDDAYGYEWKWTEASNTTGGAGGFWWINGAFPVQFDDRLMSDTYTRGACTEVALTFKQDFAKNGGDDFAFVQIQVGDGTWQTMTTLSASADGDYDIDLSPYLPSADSEFRIRFRYVGEDNLYWKVDDFELVGAP